MSWYKKTKLKRPYKVYMKCPDLIKFLGVINVPQNTEATETKQAKAIAYKKYFNLINDYRQIDCVLMASLDEEKWQERLEIEETNKALENKQKYWWDDDDD